MGTAASIQTNVTNITNSIENTVNQKIQANGSIKCKITVDAIKFTKTNGCVATFENKCYAEADGLLETIQKLIIDFYNNLDVTQKQEAAAWFTATFGVATTTSNIENVFKNTVNQTCDAYANANNNITVKTIEINDCNAPEGQTLVFKFINAGTAKAQCAMKVLTDLSVTASNDIKTKQSQGLDWSKLIWPISIALIVILVVYSIVRLLNTKLPSSEQQIELTKIKKDNYATRISSLLDLRNNIK